MIRRLLYIIPFALFLMAATFISQAAVRDFVVVIDAGHGGKDPGARGKIINEKAINLSVALKLGKLISNKHSDVKIVYTRSTDKFVELDERAEIANRNKADLFISIHTNSVAKGNQARGTETYTLGLARTEENLAVAMRENSAILLEDDYQQKYEGFDPNSTESYIIFEFIQNKHMQQSIALASEIQTCFANSRREDRGVRQAGFLVLRKTSMPSVLIEVGFISNRDEERFLASESGQQQLAKAISEAFDRYKREYDARQVASFGKGSSEVRTTTREVSTSSASSWENENAGLDDNPPAGSEEDILRKKKARLAAQSKADTEPAVSASPAQVQSGTIYKIQILTSDKKLSADSRLLKGYDPVECVKGKRIYKYFYGATSSYKEIKQLWRKTVKDFEDAYIVVFKDGKQVNN